MEYNSSGIQIKCSVLQVPSFAKKNYYKFYERKPEVKIFFGK